MNVSSLPSIASLTWAYDGRGPPGEIYTVGAIN